MHFYNRLSRYRTNTGHILAVAIVIFFFITLVSFHLLKLNDQNNRMALSSILSLRAEALAYTTMEITLTELYNRDESTLGQCNALDRSAAHTLNLQQKQKLMFENCELRPISCTTLKHAHELKISASCKALACSEALCPQGSYTLKLMIRKEDKYKILESLKHKNFKYDLNLIQDGAS